MKNKILVSISLIIGIGFGYAQDLKLDSLATSLATAKGKTRVKLLNQLSYEYYAVSMNKSDSLANLALVEAQKLRFKEGEANAKINLAYNYTAYGKHSEAIELFSQAYDAASTNKTKALAKNGLGNTLKSLALYDSALQEYDIAYQLFKNATDSAGMASTLNNRGYSYNRIGQYEIALDNYQQAFEINGLIKNYKNQVQNLINIGFIYIDQQEEERAEKYFLEALQLTQGTQWERHKGSIYNGLALIKKDNKNYTEASDYYIKAKNSFSKAGRKASEAVVLHNLSDMHMEEGKLQQALSESLEALKLKQELNRPKSIVFSLSLLAEIYLRMNNPSVALAYANRCLDMAIKYNLKSRERVALNYVAMAYEALGNYKEALIAKKKYINLKDSLFNETKAEQLASLEKKFRVKQKEQEIALQNEKIENQQNELSTQRKMKIIYLVSGITVLVLLVIVVMMYRNQVGLTKQFKAQNKIIAAQNAENETLLKEIHHRVKNNLQVISSLLNLQSRHLEDQEAKTAVKESQSRIKSMSLIHQRLYSNDTNLATIDMAQYLKELTNFLFDTFKPEEQIHKNISVEDLNLDVDIAVPLGLIVNELISNSLKHAFTEKHEGTVNLELKAIDKTHFQLNITDDGKGIEEKGANSNSMGMQLVKTLIEQINARMEVTSKDGTSYRIFFTSLLS